MALISLLLELFVLCLLASIVLSWFPPSRPGPLATIRNALFRITEPVLAPIRRVIPPLRLGGIALDLSPLILLIAIQILQSFLVRI